MKLPRDIITALAIKFNGDWNLIFDAVNAKTCLTDVEVEQLISTLKCNYITIFDPLYPKELKNGYRPPFVLFYYGNIDLLTCPIEEKVAIVGTRRPTDYGIKITKEIASDLSKKYIIVSGMAAGVDAIAHWSVINNKGKTIAVLGSGIDYCFPYDNILLYQKLKENHLVISEYPNATEPTANKFPARNRIVAYISNGVVVTEAFGTSGSSITAGLAAGIGREVMCVPDHVGRDSCCNRLIKEGSVLVENADDVIFQLESHICKNIENS